MVAAGRRRGKEGKGNADPSFLIVDVKGKRGKKKGGFSTFRRRKKVPKKKEKGKVVTPSFFYGR